MSIIGLIVTIAIFGFIAWLVLQIPMPQPFQKVIIGVLCLILILWILQQLGIDTGIAKLNLR